MENLSGKSGGHKRVAQLTRKLRQANSEIDRILERLPLSNHQQVTHLAKLVEKQKRLVRSSPGTAPESAIVFLDNAKHSARYLQMRYNDAMKKGKLRKSR
ncbi:MAG: hypothetical protein GY697_24055 [Desulfobacterales bacterium]|nr:hypothetical protein [Desulfobacterales bacterium]